MIYKFNAKLWRRVPKDNMSIYAKYKNLEKDYYKIIISDTYKEMYDIVDKLCKEGKIERDYNGLCKSMYEIYEDGTRGNKVGYIFLVKEWTGAGIVSHECTHAVNYYFNNFIKGKNKIFTNSQYDETFAYMVGSLVYQIYKYLYEKEIIE